MAGRRVVVDLAAGAPAGTAWWPVAVSFDAEGTAWWPPPWEPEGNALEFTSVTIRGLPHGERYQFTSVTIDAMPERR